MANKSTYQVLVERQYGEQAAMSAYQQLSRKFNWMTPSPVFGHFRIDAFTTEAYIWNYPEDLRYWVHDIYTKDSSQRIWFLLALTFLTNMGTVNHSLCRNYSSKEARCIDAGSYL